MLIRPRCTHASNAIRPAREDNRLGIKRLKHSFIDTVKRMNLGINAALPHPSRNQFRDLRTKIDNQQLFVLRICCHAFFSITAKKKPSVFVEAGVSVKVQPSADHGLGASTPNFSSQTSPADKSVKFSLSSRNA